MHNIAQEGQCCTASTKFTSVTIPEFKLLFSRHNQTSPKIWHKYRRNRFAANSVSNWHTPLMQKRKLVSGVWKEYANCIPHLQIKTYWWQCNALKKHSHLVIPLKPICEIQACLQKAPFGFATVCCLTARYHRPQKEFSNGSIAGFERTKTKNLLWRK